MNFKGKVTWVGITFVALVAVAMAVLGVWRMKLHHERKEAEAAIVTIYTCPMHSEVVAETPGTCPICRRDLMPIKRPKERVVPDGTTEGSPQAPAKTNPW